MCVALPKKQEGQLPKKIKIAVADCCKLKAINVHCNCGHHAECGMRESLGDLRRQIA